MKTTIEVTAKAKNESTMAYMTRIRKAESENPGCQIIIVPIKKVSEAKMRRFDNIIKIASDETPVTREMTERMENYHRNNSRNLLEK